MKSIRWAAALCLIFWAMPCMAAEVPDQIGPFILDHDIAEFASYVDMSTELPIRYLESIKEVEIKPIKGFKSGLIAYGTCRSDNRVVRIKLKYQDNSKAFFNTLKAKIEARFGKFDIYRGDPFQVVIAWKKSFTDSRGNRISMVIQHNTRDEEEKMGNSIKLTMTNLEEAEYECHKKKSKDLSREPLKIPVQDKWDLFVPQ